MKRHLIITLLLVLIASSVSYAVPLSNADNPHNMSSSSTGVQAVNPATPGDPEDQICVFCHTPHSASPESPLWNRPEPDGMGTFPVYGLPLGINQDAAAMVLTGYDPNNPEYPSGASRMCLSCHDGATSIGVLLDNTMITMEGSDTITDHDGLKMVVDLATSHPISFNYNQNVITTLLDPLGSGRYTMPIYNSTPLDGAGQMQCTTCHDPHDDTRIALGLPFWRHTQDKGAGLYGDVCNSCHAGTEADTVPPHIIP